MRTLREDEIPIPMTIGQLAEVQAEMAEQCASIVEACMETHPSQIGPFYSQGWNKGLRTAAERIRMAYPKPHATNLGEVANEN